MIKLAKPIMPGAILCLIIPLIVLCSRENANSSTKIIYCASGLSEYIKELERTFEEDSLDVEINIASSGTLARQIIQGNSPDVFLSANKKWAEYVNHEKSADSLIPFCRNKLVLVAPRNSSIQTVDELRNQNRIALGNPGYVPAGEYTMQALTNLGLKDVLKDKYVYTKNVKSALRLVEMNECDAGFVYFSDFIASKKCRKVEIIPDSLHSPIIFYLVIFNKSTHSLQDLFTSRESIKILNKYGLTPALDNNNN